MGNAAKKLSDEELAYKEKERAVHLAAGQAIDSAMSMKANEVPQHMRKEVKAMQEAEIGFALFIEHFIGVIGLACIIYLKWNHKDLPIGSGDSFAQGVFMGAITPFLGVVTGLHYIFSSPFFSAEFATGIGSLIVSIAILYAGFVAYHYLGSSLIPKKRVFSLYLTPISYISPALLLYKASAIPLLGYMVGFTIAPIMTVFIVVGIVANLVLDQLKPKTPPRI